MERLIEELTGSGEFLNIYRLAAVRAHLLALAGDIVAACEGYRAAAGRTTSLPEQRYLAARAARLEQDAQ